MNEVQVANEVNALFSPSEIETMVKFNELETQVKFLKESKKEEIIKIFKKYGIKTFKTDSLSITYVEPMVKKVIDIKQLQKEGLYDSYLKDLPTKESVWIIVNYED